MLYDSGMKTWKKEVDQELAKALPRQVSREWIEWIADSRVEIGDMQAYDMFCEPARDLLERGGKRWRPRMMALIARMAGGQRAYELSRQLAAVVEFPHNGSLIIDDIEDSSDYRRGEPAVHKKYGVDVSINAGNFLYYLPTRLIDDFGDDDAVKLRLYRIYAKYLRRVHLGQGLDIIWHRHMEMIPSVGEYEQMCRFKTGCLSGMSAEIGASVAGMDEEHQKRFGRLAEDIGVGFQIMDDVINLEKGNPGKQRGDDIVENKKSLPVIIFANDRPDQRSRLFSVFEEAKKAGYESAQEPILSLIDQMQRLGAIEKAKKRSEKLLSDAADSIEELFDPSPDRDELTRMLHGFINA
jgi:octaprenyl-diphosphate synthase